MKNKILLIFVISLIMILAFSINIFALGDFGPYEENFTDIYGDSNIMTSEYGDFIQCLIIDFDNITEYRFFFFILDDLKLYSYLVNNYNSSSSLNYDVLGIDVWSDIDSIRQTDVYLTNINELETNINVVFGNFYQYHEINSLSYNINNLENEIIEKDNKIEEFHDLYISYLNSYNEALEDIKELENDVKYWKNEYYILNERFISINNQLGEALEEIIRLTKELENTQNNAEAYNDGYNQALEDYDIFNSGLASIFSAPMYIVNSIFGFEIFGFNFFTVIQFILSLVLIIWLFEKMR